MSQETLAEGAERHVTYVSLIERGRNSPSLATLYKLARALKTTPTKLLAEVDQLLKESDSSGLQRR